MPNKVEDVRLRTERVLLGGASFASFGGAFSSGVIGLLSSFEGEGVGGLKEFVDRELRSKARCGVGRRSGEESAIADGQPSEAVCYLTEGE